MWTKTYRVVGFLEPGVVKFGDKNLMIYISKEAIERYSHRLKGKPITIGHIEGITEENAQEVSVGDVAVCSNPGECIVTINNEEADQRISNGERFSCCWIPVKWGPAGTWHNIPYDRELVEMDFTHLAIVPDPRYENVEVFMNSKEYKNKSYRVSDSDQGFNIGPGSNPNVTYNPGSATKVRRASTSKSVDMSSKYLSGQDKGTQGRKVVRVSSFQNSLNPKQYAFLKKYIKEWNNAKVDEGLSPERKRAARMDRQTNWTESGVHHAINYKANAGRNFMMRLSNPQDYRRVYTNEVDTPDDSSERMSRINAYLQKREDRRMDKQYQTQEAPKQFAERTSTHFSGYKNSCKSMFRHKDGREFNNESFKKSLYSSMSKKRLADNMMTGRQVQNEYKEGIGTNLYGGQSGKLKVTKGFNK